MIRFKRRTLCLAPCLALGLALGSLGVAACGSDGDPEPDAAIPDPVGTFTASWAVTNGSAPVSCDDVGADSIRISAVEVNSAFGTVVGFSCDEAMGTSRELAVGTYRLDFDLRTGNGRSLLAAPLRVEDVIIETGGNATVEAQTFPVTPSGSLAFSLAATEVTMGNCALEADGGAGITALQFNLRDAAMACVPTTFTIAAGALPGGIYVSDCIELNQFPCIGADQAVSADPTPSGARTLEILGYTEGGLACRRHLAQYAQPGNNLPEDLTELGMQINNAIIECIPDP